MRYYGRYNDNPEDVTRCVEPVIDRAGWYSHQCSRPRGHGIGGLMCKQHANRTPPQDKGIRKSLAHPMVGQIVWFVKDGKARIRDSRDIESVKKLVEKLTEDLAKCREFLSDCEVPA